MKMNSNAEFLYELREKLMFVYGVDPNMSWMIRLNELIKDLDRPQMTMVSQSTLENMVILLEKMLVDLQSIHRSLAQSHQSFDNKLIPTSHPYGD